MTSSGSDLQAIRRWWKTLGGPAFVVLEPPTRNRYTQSDGHDDFAELGEPAGTSFAYWHWQSHERAFDAEGMLTGALLLHWGGDHATVAAGLGAGPEGYGLVDGGDGSAFFLDRETQRDASGLPDPDDRAGVRQFLDDLEEPLDRSRTEFSHPPLTAEQEAWLHGRIAEGRDLADLVGILRVLEFREAITAREASDLARRWQAEHSDLPTFAGWAPVLSALLRHGDEAAWPIVAELGSPAHGILGSIPGAHGEEILREALDRGEVSAIAPLLGLEHRRLGGRATVGAADEAVARIAGLLDGLPATEASWGELGLAQMHLHERNTLPSTVHALRSALDERLPHGFRANRARYVQDELDRLRELAQGLESDAEILPGWTAGQAVDDVGRLDGQLPELLAGSGPDLTQYEGGLVDAWDAYRILDPAGEDWLHQQIADPRTELQGLAFCLEALHAHGRATAADVDALAGRWRKVLAKSYRTTYTEWRHPLVVLTCLAQEVEHPQAEKLLAWWQKTPPAWKRELAPLTGLGAPGEGTARALWEHLSAGGHDTGHLITWALLQSRLQDRAPVLILDELLGSSASPIRRHVVVRSLIAVVDPAQPLWHYSIGDSPGWWDRIVEVAEHPDLSDAARAAALEAAALHRLVAHPDSMRPRPSEAAVVAARQWLDEQAAR